MNTDSLVSENPDKNRKENRVNKARSIAVAEIEEKAYGYKDA